MEEHAHGHDDLQERLLPAAGSFDKDHRQEDDEEGEEAMLRSSVEDD